MDFKTVEGPSRIQDPLLRKRHEDVAKMRASLLSCSEGSCTVSQTLNNITVLRIYHQVARIIQYLDLMDKLEDKLYESISNEIDSADTFDPSSWMTLLTIQDKLQSSMIASHKLLQPYLESAEVFKLLSQETEAIQLSSDSILPYESRDKVRIAATKVLQNLAETG